MKAIFPQSFKNLYHWVQALLANIFYLQPSRKIKVIGVTGTNGKTTTCQMVAKVLEEAGNKVAMISTINFKLGEKEWVNATKFTTVSAFATQKFITEAVNEECDYLVLETSSHSLNQYRVWGVKYAVAVITNVTREHLDYHKTMEQYRQVKLGLFKNVKTAIVNLDMEKPEDFLACGAKKIFGYTTSDQKSVNSEQKMQIVRAENIKLGIDGSEFEIDGNKTEAKLLELQKLSFCFKLNLPGLFNVENALAATCVGISEGIELATIKKALEKITKISGRMDGVENKLGLKIIIDYAVTPDSLEKLGALISQQKSPSQSLIWVFGSCGERDRGKRPLMGEIVGKFADYIFVTNEDPYNENPVEIISQVFGGVVGKDVMNFQFSIFNFQSISNDKISNAKKWEEGENCWRILDRREAIKNALKLAKKGDIILVTGKGAEETMAVGKKRIDWNDRRVIEEELIKMRTTDLPAGRQG